MNVQMELKRSNKLKEAAFFEKLKKELKINKFVYLMAIPIIIFYTVFHYIPMGGVVIAFQDFKPAKGLLGSSWVGLSNFVDFLSSTYALRVIKNTVIISVYEIIFGFPAPIILALLINEVKNSIYKRTIQTISYMPHFISLVVICGIIVDFTKTGGLVNDVVVLFGGERQNFLNQKEFFRTIFVSTGIWQQVGWSSIIYLATLSSIDPSLYEAAVIDGAGRFKQVLHITLPSLVPTIVVLLIMRLGHIMSGGFEKTILLYNPLTYETGDVISSYVYRRGLQETNYSLGAAVGLFNSVINYMILISSNAVSRKFVKESLW